MQLYTTACAAALCTLQATYNLMPHNIQSIYIAPTSVTCMQVYETLCTKALCIFKYSDPHKSARQFMFKQTSAQNNTSAR